MKRIVEADDNGSIRLAGEWTGVKPHARYILESQGNHVVLTPAVSNTSESIWRELTPQQRADEFMEWIRQNRTTQHSSDVHLTNEQLRRENMYD